MNRPQLTRAEMVHRIVTAAPVPTDTQIELVRRLVLPVPTQTRTLPSPLNTGETAPRMRVPSQSRATHPARPSRRTVRRPPSPSSSSGLPPWAAASPGG